MTSTDTTTMDLLVAELMLAEAVGKPVSYGGLA